MIANVNQRVTPVAEGDGDTCESPSFTELLQQKKKKSPCLDQLESLIQLIAPLAQQPPDTGIAPAVATRGLDPTLSSQCHDLTSLPAGDTQQVIRPLAHSSRGAAATGEPTAPRKPIFTQGNASTLSAVAARQVRATVTNKIPDTMEPHRALHSGETERATAPARRHRLPEKSEQGAAPVAATLQMTPHSASSPPAVAAEDTWFTSQAAPAPQSMQQGEGASGMKLSYQFQRWGGGQVDISAQPNQLLFQPSTEMVRERLGASLISHPQSQAWQMDEQPEHHQQQQQHQNDEDEY